MIYSSGQSMKRVGNKFKAGDNVECNGNKESRVIGYYSTVMVDVRLWEGFRHIGDVCVNESELKPI